MSDALIVLNSVSLRHSHRVVLQNLSLGVRRGEHTAFVGVSGVGKSTLLSAIAGLLIPSSGSIAIGGERVTGPVPAATMMLQRPALLPWATALENVMLGLHFSGQARRDPSRAQARALDLLERVGLADRRSARPAELSGGEQQRVSLARALAPRPSVLLLDEPFSALDSVTRATLRKDIGALTGDDHITLLLVTHDVADATALCRRVVRLDGRPASIVSDETLPVPIIRLSSPQTLPSAA